MGKNRKTGVSPYSYLLPNALTRLGVIKDKLGKIENGQFFFHAECDTKDVQQFRFAVALNRVPESSRKVPGVRIGPEQ